MAWGEPNLDPNQDYYQARAVNAERRLAEVRGLANQLLRAAHENRVNPEKAATYEDVAGDILALVGEDE